MPTCPIVPPRAMCVAALLLRRGCAAHSTARQASSPHDSRRFVVTSPSHVARSTARRRSRAMLADSGEAVSRPCRGARSRPLNIPAYNGVGPHPCENVHLQFIRTSCIFHLSSIPSLRKGRAHIPSREPPPCQSTDPVHTHILSPSSPGVCWFSFFRGAPAEFMSGPQTTMMRSPKAIASPQSVHRPRS